MDYGERKLLFVIICTYCMYVHLYVSNLILDTLLCEGPSFCTVYYYRLNTPLLNPAFALKAYLLTAESLGQNRQ